MMTTSRDKATHEERRLSIVEESLKTLRAIHRMLMLLCATVFVVDLSPSGQNDYSAEMAELNAVARIGLDRFIADSLKNIEATGKGTDLARIYSKAFDSAMRREFEKIGFGVPRESMGHEVFLAGFDEGRAWSLLRNGTVSDYRDFLSDNIGVECVFIEPEKIATALVEKVPDVNIPANSEIGGMKLVMAPPVHTGDGIGTFRVKLILFFFVEEPKVRHYHIVVEKNFVSKGGQVDETRIQSWLERQGTLKDLVESSVVVSPPYKTESLFPNLKYVWSLVADETPEEGKRILMEKASESQREVLLLGVPFDVGMVVFAAPMVTTIIYLFFLSYLAHLKRIYDGAGEILHEFPWLLLFPGVNYSRASKALVLLPSLALVLLVGRHLRIGDWTLIPGIVFTVFSVILAFYCLREINHLRKKASLAA